MSDRAENIPIREGKITPASKSFDVRISESGPVLKLSVSVAKGDFKVFGVEDQIKTFLSNKSFDSKTIDRDLEQYRLFTRELEAAIVTARNYGRIELEGL